ncbi:MAG: hypothetical protein Q9181_003314 [Wetmoreana brouardii]
MANLNAGLDHQDADYENHLAELNAELEILVKVFPNVLPEVFREMLLRFDGESRLELVVNQLLKYEALWVKGRWRPQSEDADASDAKSLPDLPETDLFRRNSYKWAVKAALIQEFKSLSKSTVKAVLAEQNHSYHLARPVLQDIASKSWRHSISKFFTKWSKRGNDGAEKQSLIRWTKSADGTRVPILKATGDPELDHELHQTVLAPIYAQVKVQQEANDWDLAIQINQEEAENGDALFECACCYSATTFERIATCSASTHIICFSCIFRSVSEALFGQSWARGVDHDRGLLRCVAPAAHDGCEGCIPQNATQRAVCQSKGGSQLWLRLQSRLAEEALAKAQLPLVRCPLCSYAEVTDLYLPPGSLRYRLNMKQPLRTLGCLFLGLGLTPFLCASLLLNRLIFEFGTTPSPLSIVQTSISRLVNTSQSPTRFQCRSPTCSALTCMTCSKPWRDPHTCFESAAIELRTTIEAARTAALKRTCPKCNLAFIKDSGCNKLTCMCGYTMCYVCRQALGPSEGGEGYAHFCQHFRLYGGRCEECEKCDLYRDEDKDEVVRTAGMEAEREWREKQELKTGTQGTGSEKQDGGVADTKRKREEWSVQGLVDWLVRNVLTCYVQPQTGIEG